MRADTTRTGMSVGRGVDGHMNIWPKTKRRNNNKILMKTRQHAEETFPVALARPPLCFLWCEHFLHPADTRRTDSRRGRNRMSPVVAGATSTDTTMGEIAIHVYLYLLWARKNCKTRSEGGTEQTTTSGPVQGGDLGV